jgi:Protein of unknown function (DUF2442)
LSPVHKEKQGFDKLSPNGYDNEMNDLILPDERVLEVRFDDASLILDLMDGRTIYAPLSWYPRLLHATPEQREAWEMAGAGCGIHWPDIDEDLSAKGLLRGAPGVNCP